MAALMPWDGTQGFGPQDGEGSRTLSVARSVMVAARNHEKAGAIVGALQDRGIPALQASTELQALFWAREQPPALVLLDLDMDGARDVLTELRGIGKTVHALSDNPESRVQALEKGCIEASPASLGPIELAIKTVALMRARRPMRFTTVEKSGLRVDLTSATIAWQGREIEATPILVRLAAYLVAHAGQLVPARVLLEEVWEEDWGKPWKVYQAIWRLRCLLGDEHERVIIGKRGHGYGFFPATSDVSLRQLPAS